MGIHIEFNEENIQEAVAMIIGPKESEYSNGILFFKIRFPNDYPFSPPKVDLTQLADLRPTIDLMRSSGVL